MEIYLNNNGVKILLSSILTFVWITLTFDIFHVTKAEQLSDFLYHNPLFIYKCKAETDEAMLLLRAYTALQKLFKEVPERGNHLHSFIMIKNNKIQHKNEN